METFEILFKIMIWRSVLKCIFIGILAKFVHVFVYFDWIFSGFQLPHSQMQRPEIILEIVQKHSKKRSYNKLSSYEKTKSIGISSAVWCSKLALVAWCLLLRKKALINCSFLAMGSLKQGCNILESSVRFDKST